MAVAATLGLLVDARPLEQCLAGELVASFAGCVRELSPGVGIALIGLPGMGITAGEHPGDTARRDNPKKMAV